MSEDLFMPNGMDSSGEEANFASVLLDCVAAGFITIGPKKELLAFNSAADRLTGLHGADILQQSTTVLPPPLRDVIDETFATGKPVLNRRVVVKQADGTNDLLQITTTVAQSEAGDVLSVVVELQSVSHAQSMAANLEHLDRLASIGLLSAGVAHEIKNALVAIRTLVELPSTKCDDPQLADVVRKEIERIDTIVRQVLSGAAREAFHLVPLSTHALVKETLSLLGHQLETASIQLDVALSASRDRINGDERQLRHAFLNLLINGLESMNGNGHLTIGTEVIAVAGRPHLRVDISDRGSGIRPEHLPRLFRPFFTTKKEGTGLGLAITRRIIQQHNGAITVQSKVDEGTTFQVFLPLLEDSDQSSGPR